MKKYVALFVTALLLVAWAGAASAAGGVQKSIGNPNLEANVTMNASYSRGFHWDIKKSVTPSIWNLFNGDQAVSTYTVTVTKSGSTDFATLTGNVNVQNTGTMATQGLAISAKLQADSGSGYVDVAQTTVSTSAMPDLGQNTSGSNSFSYPYSFQFTPIPGATYKVIANITILNDISNYGVPTGISVSTSGVLPSTPSSVSYDTVHVTDSWAGAGSPWTFSQSGSVSYTRTFGACESGVFNNTATITETNQSASASVTVNRYSLSVAKTAAGSLCRKYIWTIDKTGDKTCLKISPNQTAPVNYTVTVTATPQDANYTAKGTITVTNSAPIDAVINSVTDIATGGIAGQINASSITFPYTLKSGATLSLPYTMTLPDASARTNTATAVQQNFLYTATNKTAIGTKSISGSTGIVFGSPTVVDGSAVITDNLFGTLGTVQATASPAVFHYTLKIGLTGTSSSGYSIAVSKCLPGKLFPKCTDTSWKVTNTATLTTCDTHTVLNDSWVVTITKGTVVYTYTIGYWKNHTCDITKLLPIWLGTQSGCKSIDIKCSSDAVKYLSMSEGSASNGIVKLYAQLLAAKLNIKNGADPSAVSSVIASADAFLAKNDINSWSGLSTTNKNLVLSWATTLDNYNNGVIGPGHGG